MSKYFPKIPKAFGAEWYLNKYQDVKKDSYYGEHAWEHFVNHGLGEGREHAPDIIGPPLPPPSPSPDSPYFNFFGQQKFLVFASYFDGIRAKHLEQDLDYLKSKGVDGFRLYLNFGFPDPRNRPWNFIFNPDGSLNPYKLGSLGHILRLAEKREMVVDISSSRRGGRDEWQMPPGTYAHAWRLLSIELKSWGFQNFILDIENEHTGAWAGRQAMTEAEAALARNAIKGNLPNVLITASVANASPGSAAAIGWDEGMNVLAWHDPRNTDFAKNTESYALQCKAAVGESVFVYFQEPARAGWGDAVKSSDDLLTALNGAKAAQIAGWCFHNAGSFTLSDGNFESKLRPLERGFLNRITS